MSQINWFTLALYIGSITLVGLCRTSKVTKQSQYLLAERKTGLIALVATLVMTELNTSTLISFSAFGYLAGLSALQLPLIFLFGLLFYALTVAKKWKEYDGVSVAGYFSKRYGNDVGLMTALILSTAMLCFTATYIKSLTLIYTPLFPSTPPALLSAILISLVLLMVLKGGLVSIIRTDLMSFFSVTLIAPFLIYFAYQSPSDATATPQINISFDFVFSLILLTMFSYILAPWHGQKIISAKTTKIAFFGTLIAALCVCFFYGVAIAITISLQQTGAILQNPDMALPHLLSKAPDGFKGLGYGILFSITATTLSGVWSALVTLIINYLPDQKESKNTSLLLTLAFALLSYLLANTLIGKIFNSMILANIPIVALSFALLAGFYWPKASKAGAYTSFAVGTFGGIACYLYFGEQGGYTWYWACVIIPLIFLSGAATSLLYPDKFQVEKFSEIS